MPFVCRSQDRQKSAKQSMLDAERGTLDFVIGVARSTVVETVELRRGPTAGIVSTCFRSVF